MKIIPLGIALVLCWMAFDMHRTGRVPHNLYELDRDQEPVKFSCILIVKTAVALVVLVYALGVLAE